MVTQEFHALRLCTLGFVNKADMFHKRLVCCLLQNKLRCNKIEDIARGLSAIMTIYFLSAEMIIEGIV